MNLVPYGSKEIAEPLRRKIRLSVQLVYQVEQAMKKQVFNQTGMARGMKTSRTVVRRLLDSDDTSVTLATLAL